MLRKRDKRRAFETEGWHLTDAPTPLPPGWYPDPNGVAEQLYWDGRAWHTAPLPPSRASHSQPRKTVTKVKCFKCHHVQTEPAGRVEFTCEECGQKLRRRGAQAPPPPPTPSPPKGPAPTTPNAADNDARRMAVNLGVLLLAGIGLFLSAFTTTTLLSGSTTVWIGVALAGTGTALSFFLGAANGVRVTAAICFALSVASGLYIEHELDKRRHEVSSVFDSHP